MKADILIIGMGWLGTPLAKKLSENFTLITTKRSASNIKDESNNIKTIKFDFAEKKQVEIFSEIYVNQVIISVPSSKIDNEGLKEILSKLKVNGTTKVILISSTGIYAENNQTINEDDDSSLLKDSNLFAIEQTVSQSKIDYVIVRFGGLIGEGRHPIKFLQSKALLQNPVGRINYICQKDCVRLLDKIVNSELRNEIINGVANEHPTKKEFYTTVSLNLGLDEPKFEEVKSNFKIIDNQKSKSLLSFEYTPLYESVSEITL